MPLSSHFWPRRLLLLALAPALLAWCALILLLLLGPWTLAPLAPALPMLARTGGSPEARAGSWLLAWAFWVALASEALLKL